MTSLIVLCVSLCTLCILQSSILVYGDPDTDDQESKPLRRTVREVNAPAAVDCKMSPWSEWSECDPCSKKMFRSRSVETFGQFKGLVCTQPIGDSKSCKTQAVCDHEEPQCSETHFLCDSGRCIKKRLECNGDNDCGDHSDENCDEEPKRPPCQNRDIEVSELGRTAGYGVNVLRMEPRSNPFDNEYYNGNCDRVRDGNTKQYYRRPWNVATLLYETFADESFSKEVYENSDSLVKDILTETSLGFEVGMSFKIKPTEGPISAANGSVDINLDANFNRIETLNTLNEYSVKKTQSFLRVKGRIQLGTFRIRSRDLMLADTFVEDLKFLPVEYEKGEYFRFFEDYGTHYAVSGKVGGQYDLVFVINKQELKRRNMEVKDVQDCLGFNLGMDINAASMSTFTTNIKPEFCKKTKDGTTGTKTTNGVIENTLSLVHGGTVAYAASFRKQINEEGVADVSSYIEWAKSLSDAPVLIETTPTPIYTLVPVTMQHANIKKENMERALNDYIAEYNVCKCKPCQNGGTVTLLDGKCICLCPINYEGLACQTLKKTDLKDVFQSTTPEGNWGCWSAWSQCSSRKRTRTRTCNTEGSGGTCKGDTSSSDYC
ncbi:complement component C9 [Acipenser ruthenus]|uniref:complement component C9 n=1 Tax=Acipenser ruthenus TaxID=7906 RepID=UPI00145AB6F2|nr:complement component C9 [Acipenser ruthenus]